MTATPASTAPKTSEPSVAPTTTADAVTADASSNTASATPFSDAAAVEKSSSGSSTPQWTQHYDRAAALLPQSISARLPTSQVAASHVSQLGDKLSTLSSQAKEQAGSLSRTGSERFAEVKGKAGERYDQLEGEVLTQAWSVTNATNVALNISLNQVGPVHYAVVLPNEIFERRVPNIWYSLSIRPWTGPSSAYSPFSVAWPILAVTGPVIAGASLLAIPFVALAAGGTALASLTGFGAEVAGAVGSGAASVGSAGATAAGIAAKVSSLPGGGKVKGKMVDATKRMVGENGEALTGKVVRYLTKSAAAGAAGGAIEGEKQKHKHGPGKEKKAVEVDITGYELEQALKCETGKSKVDKHLKEAFEGLCIKESSFKTKDNPVLRVVGGPELEERNDKQFLVFHHFVIERVIDIAVEPLSTEETAPTTEEATFLRDARLVPSLSEAETAVSKAPKHGEGEWAAEKGKKGGEVERALEEATGVKAEEESAAEEVVDVEGVKVQKKRWWGFGWGK